MAELQGKSETSANAEGGSWNLLLAISAQDFISNVQGLLKVICVFLQTSSLSGLDVFLRILASFFPKAFRTFFKGICQYSVGFVVMI